MPWNSAKLSLHHGMLQYVVWFESNYRCGIATHLAGCAVQRQSSVSSCCSRPLCYFSASLCSMPCIYRTTSSTACAAVPPPTQWLAVTSCTTDWVSSGVSCNLVFLLAAVTDCVQWRRAVCCSGYDNSNRSDNLASYLQTNTEKPMTA